jgi:hypothetical protein
MKLNVIAVFKRCGAIGTKLGLEYAGDWKKFREFCHLQYRRHA